MDDLLIFDRAAVRAHRDRAAARLALVRPVLDDLAQRLLDRLDDTERRFAVALDIGGRGVVASLLATRGMAVVSTDVSPAIMAGKPGPDATLRVVADEEFLPFGAARFDLIVANLSLHWVNDLPGALIQLRQALKPEGLFLASIPLLGTLAGFRTALIEAEAALSGGASPRISPFPTLPDCAGLMQRAGFALPVVERETIDLDYAEPLGLLRDLRDAGETNATIARSRRIPARGLFPMALASLAGADGRVRVGLEVGVLSGWGS